MLRILSKYVMYSQTLDECILEMLGILGKE